jgi:hypothetical protein
MIRVADVPTHGEDRVAVRQCRGCRRLVSDENPNVGMLATSARAFTAPPLLANMSTQRAPTS